MSLPIKDDMDIEKILSDRPGDDLYPSVKPRVESVDEEEKTSREKLVDLILKDLTQDLAVANSFDDIGVVLEYLAQKRQIEPPEFSGDILMKNFSRISKLKLSLKYAEMIGLTGVALDLMLKAEVERLWGDTSSALLKKLLVNKSATTVTNSPRPIETGVKQNVEQNPLPRL